MELVLDPRINSHVLTPITIIMLLVHILRGLIGRWLMEEETPMLSTNKVRELHHLNRLRTQGSSLGAANNSLCDSEWTARRLALETQYSAKLGGLKNVLMDTEEHGSSGGASAGLISKIWPQIKMTILQYAPQPVLLFYMSYFFQGYVVLKLPFYLTGNFKEMLHNSITTPDLNVEYVTAISWYFVNLAGMESLADVVMAFFGYILKTIGLSSSSYLDSSPTQKILLENLQNMDSILSVGGVSNLVNKQAQQQQQPMSLIPGMAQPKSETIFTQHVESLKMIKPMSVLNDIEVNFLERFAK